MICLLNKSGLKKLSKKKLIEEFLKRQDELILSEKEKEALEKELRKYKNLNTPPSAHPHLKPAFSNPSLIPPTPAKRSIVLKPCFVFFVTTFSG